MLHTVTKVCIVAYSGADKRPHNPPAGGERGAKMASFTFTVVSDADAPFEVREAEAGRFAAMVKAPKSGGKATWELMFLNGHHLAGGYAIDLAAAQVAAREAMEGWPL